MTTAELAHDHGRWSKALAAISICFALLYWLGDRGAGFEFSPSLVLLAKGAAIGFLIAAVAIPRRPGWGILVLGLVAHSAGDLSLDILEASILPAIGFFLIGHLAYLVLFLQRKDPWTRWRLVSASSIVLLGCLALWVLLPRVGAASGPGPLQIALPFYITAIAAMAIAAQRRSLPIAIGAWAYLVSDSLIGWSRLVGPIGFGAVLTWPLYYSAQFLITRNWRRPRR